MSQSTQTRTVSLLGCGWLGIALAHSLIERGVHVRGSTTRSSRLGLLTSLGVEAFLLRIEPDGAGSEGLGAFFESDCLLIDLPPEISLGADYHLGQISSILSMIAARPPRQLVYVSSTSVYGAGQGAVDETTPPVPDGESGTVLLQAEQMLSSFARESGVGLTIVRPGGLMGPGRHPGLFLAGRKSVRNGQAPVNMIHQLDLSDLIASLIVDHPAEGVAIFNAVDAHHPTREEFYSRASKAIGVEAPEFAPAGVTAETDKIAAAAGKIVIAEKIRKLTGVRPRFQTLFEAIGAL